MALADYLISYLGNLNTTLGYIAGNLSVVVSDTLSDLGVSTEAQADARELNLMGKVNLFRKILIDLSGDYDVSLDGNSYKRSDFYNMIEKNYQLALNDALYLLPTYSIETETVNAVDVDPYYIYPHIES